MIYWPLCTCPDIRWRYLWIARTWTRGTWTLWISRSGNRRPPCWNFRTDTDPPNIYNSIVICSYALRKIVFFKIVVHEFGSREKLSEFNHFFLIFFERPLAGHVGLWFSKFEFQMLPIHVWMIPDSVILKNVCDFKVSPKTRSSARPMKVFVYQMKEKQIMIEIWLLGKIRVRHWMKSAIVRIVAFCFLDNDRTRMLLQTLL